MAHWTVWTAVAAAWVFMFASLVSFDAADPPTHTIWPANDPIHNWCGPVGAWFAYKGVKLLGIGVWVVMISWGVWLGMVARGRRVSLPILRVIGLLMMTVGVAALQALIAPGSARLAGLGGGLAGTVLTGELVARFSLLGTFLWIMLLTLVGAVVALDRFLLSIPAAIAWRVAPLSEAARAGATDAARRGGGGLVAGLASLAQGIRPVKVRVDDIEDDEALEEVAATVSRDFRAKPRTRVKLQARDDATVAEIKPRRKNDPKAPAAEVVDEVVEDDEDDLPGAPQVFDEERLREKIARLPTRFARDDRRVATDADLRDLQGVEDLEGYAFPTLDLLSDPEENFTEKLEEIVRGQAEALEAALRQYRIKGEVVGIESGPVITLYHLALAPGTKVAQIQNVASDIARTLKAVNIRIVANMVGRDTVGVEVPNPTKEKVRIKELMSRSDVSGGMKLPMFLGKDASGDPLIADLTKMPHMLIAGTTGSGKSVCMNSIIMSFLFTKKPNELKLVLVDPKMVEMGQFKDIPHLMCPVVTEMSKAAAILEWAMNKMDERYELLAEAGVRDIAGYNETTWEELKERFQPQTPEEEARIPRKLPYMVFIIDELADLMMTNKEVEGSIIRIAQKARAVGIHLILATQRPQANVVTGLIKSNMPCRIAFKVASGMDSRIVLDQKGGELLLGQGDMLYLSPHSHKLIRAQGTLVDDPEIRRIVRYLRDVARPSFERQLVQLRSLDADEERLAESENNSSASLQAAQEDPMFDRAVEIVLETKRGSVSLLQRRLAIGYTRASRLIDLMGIAGIIGEHKGSVAREVMITPAEWDAMKALHERELARLNAGQGELFACADAPEADDALLDLDDAEETDEIEIIDEADDDDAEELDDEDDEAEIVDEDEAMVDEEEEVDVDDEFVDEDEDFAADDEDDEEWEDDEWEDESEEESDELDRPRHAESGS